MKHAMHREVRMMAQMRALPYGHQRSRGERSSSRTMMVRGVRAPARRVSLLTIVMRAKRYAETSMTGILMSETSELSKMRDAKPAEGKPPQMRMRGGRGKPFAAPCFSTARIDCSGLFPFVNGDNMTALPDQLNTSLTTPTVMGAKWSTPKPGMTGERRLLPFTTERKVLRYTLSGKSIALTCGNMHSANNTARCSIRNDEHKPEWKPRQPRSGWRTSPKRAESQCNKENAIPLLE